MPKAIQLVSVNKEFKDKSVLHPSLILSVNPLLHPSTSTQILFLSPTSATLSSLEGSTKNLQIVIVKHYYLSFLKIKNYICTYAITLVTL